MRMPSLKSAKIVFLLLLGLLGSQQVSHAVDAKMVTASIQEYFPEQPAVPNLEFERLETLPVLDGASEWMNGQRDRPAYFTDKPVLVHFWSHSCVQCIDDLSFMKKWYSTFRKHGLEVVSIHSPSYVSEQRLDLVRDAVKDLGVNYPVAFDQDFVIWHKFYNRFWPTTYLFDQQHNLVYTHIGTGGYEQTEKEILAVLDLEPEDIVEAPPEEEVRTYIPLGHYKQRWYGGVEKINRAAPSFYSFPETLGIEQWALEGEWEFTDLTASLVSGAGRMQIFVNEPDINISFSVKDFKQTKVMVFVDGKYVPVANKGKDLRVDTSEGGISFFYIEAQKHYELIKGLSGPHMIEIRVDHPGTTIHSVSFPLRFPQD